MEPCLPRSAARAIALADATVQRLDPSRMRWMWGQALLCFALGELDDFLGGDRYLPFYKAYCDRWLARPPRVDQSDTVAPALAALAAYRRTGDKAYLDLAERPADYVRKAPRIAGEFVNHLGHSPEGRLYPKSVWVDSLMMFGVFAARHAKITGDAELLAFAARQPAAYAGVLQDPEDGLFVHSWRSRSARPYPRKLYWGRGNGWVVASLAILLDELEGGGPGAEAEIPAIRGILERESAGLLALRRADGFWDTILPVGRGPGRGRNYPEASATALVAGGWMRAVRRGWLDPAFLGPAATSFEALAESLVERPDGPSLTGVSAPTIPLPLFPRAGYSMVPRANDLSYGLAAFFLAAIERARLDGKPGQARP